MAKKKEQSVAAASFEDGDPDVGAWTTGVDVYISLMYDTLADEATSCLSKKLQAELRRAVEYADHAYHRLDADTAMVAMFNAGAALSRADLFDRFKVRQDRTRELGSANKMPAAERAERAAQWQQEIEAMSRKNPHMLYTAISDRVGRKHDVTGRTVRRYCRNPHPKK